MWKMTSIKIWKCFSEKEKDPMGGYTSERIGVEGLAVIPHLLKNSSAKINRQLQRQDRKLIAHFVCCCVLFW